LPALPASTVGARSAGPDPLARPGACMATRDVFAAPCVSGEAGDNEPVCTSCSRAPACSGGRRSASQLNGGRAGCSLIWPLPSRGEYVAKRPWYQLLQVMGPKHSQPSSVHRRRIVRHRFSAARSWRYGQMARRRLLSRPIRCDGRSPRRDKPGRVQDEHRWLRDKRGGLRAQDVNEKDTLAFILSR
jgi:hypothetical protein